MPQPEQPNRGRLLSEFEPVPNRVDVLGKTIAENSALAEKLELNLPGDLDSAPPTLAFDRVREISLPWPRLVEQMSRNKEGDMTSVSPLRSYFERSWWGEDRSAPTTADLRDLFDDGLAFILPSPEGMPNFVRYDGDDKPGDPVTEGIVFRNGLSGRYYLIETVDGTTPPLATPRDYTMFWEQYVDGAELVFAEDDDLKNCQTVYDELNLRAIHIERKFRELKEMQRVVQIVSQKAGATLEEIIEQGRTSDLSFEGLESVQSRYISIRLNPYRVERNLRQLKKQAAQMGYLLFLGDEPGMAKVKDSDAGGALPVHKKVNKFPNGETKDVFAGELYTTFRRTCVYTVKHKKSVVQNIGEGIGYAFKRLFGGKAKKPKTTWTETRAKVVKDYKKVDTLTDPLTARIMQYRDAGREVHVFQETPSGYMTEDGMALATIMMRCDYDEGFRRNCVVMLPVFEPGFAVEKPIVAYNIFERPLPGIMPTRLPRLFVDESLTYRIAWKGAELGELVSTINLAPGETREINITRSFQEERSSSETRTTVSELNSSETTDIATEMETVARTENEFSAHADYSSEASASASVDGIFSGSASSKFSAGASNTLKTFNQGMNKVAKKAATSISRKNKLDVSTTSTAKTSVSTSDSTVIKMSNINEGRTLNLMFYRVFNRFASGLFIENLKFGVTSGVELIAGSGVYETMSFHPNRIKEMLDMFRRTPLPFNNAPSALVEYEGAILDTLLEQLRFEYLDEQEPPEEKPEPKAPARAKPKAEPVGEVEQQGGSSNAVVIPRDLIALFDKPSPPAGGGRDQRVQTSKAREVLDARIAQVEAGLSKIEMTSTALDPSGNASSDLLIASSGLYLDSIVGARPSTEPYSEEMRAQEVRKSAAEVLKSEAEAQYSLAQASRIQGMPRGANPARNTLTGVHLVTQGTMRLLSLGFALPLQSGRWVICFDGDPVTGGAIPEDQLNRTSVALKLPAKTRRSKPDWSDQPDLMTRITLRDEDTHDEIAPA